jgi:hypothetical protein
MPGGAHSAAKLQTIKKNTANPGGLNSSSTAGSAMFRFDPTPPGSA